MLIQGSRVWTDSKHHIDQQAHSRVQGQLNRPLRDVAAWCALQVLVCHDDDDDDNDDDDDDSYDDGVNMMIGGRCCTSAAEAFSAARLPSISSKCSCSARFSCSAVCQSARQL
eukprot:1818626-Rhodomonas_salina.1